MVDMRLILNSTLNQILLILSQTHMLMWLSQIYKPGYIDEC